MMGVADLLHGVGFFMFFKSPSAVTTTPTNTPIGRQIEAEMTSDCQDDHSTRYPDPSDASSVTLNRSKSPLFR